MEHHAHGAYAHHHPSPHLADGHTHPQAADPAVYSPANRLARFLDFHPDVTENLAARLVADFLLEDADAGSPALVAAAFVRQWQAGDAGLLEHIAEVRLARPDVLDDLADAIGPFPLPESLGHVYGVAPSGVHRHRHGPVGPIVSLDAYRCRMCGAELCANCQQACPGGSVLEEDRAGLNGPEGTRRAEAAARLACRVCGVRPRVGAGVYCRECLDAETAAESTADLEAAADVLDSAAHEHEYPAIPDYGEWNGRPAKRYVCHCGHGRTLAIPSGAVLHEGRMPGIGGTGHE